MSKIVKLYSLQFILLAALICSISIDKKYFYLPIIIGVFASICFYYTVKESIKVLLQLKDYNLKKHEEQQKFYMDILKNTEMISKENINRINSLEEQLTNVLKSIQKNDNVLNNKLSDLISEIRKEISSQRTESKKYREQLYAEFKGFIDNYNKVNKNTSKTLCNEIKQSSIRLKDEIRSNSNEVIGVLSANNDKNKEALNELCANIKEQSSEMAEVINNKADESIRITASSLHKLVENTKHANMKLDNNQENICASIEEYCEKVHQSNSICISELKNEIIELLKVNNNELSKISSESTNFSYKENNSGELLNEEIEKESDLGIEALAVMKQGDEVKEYSTEDSHGIDYFINDKIVRHEDINGSITEYKYDEDNIKEAVTKKDGKIIRVCSYVDGVLNECKVIEN